jgi:hypothetical protein
MGYYIQTPDKQNVANQIIELHGATEVIPAFNAPKWEDTKDQALIGVVKAGPFDAAMVGYCKQEHDYILSMLLMDPRPMRILLLNRKLAFKLCGYGG